MYICLLLTTDIFVLNLIGLSFVFDSNWVIFVFVILIGFYSIHCSNWFIFDFWFQLIGIWLSILNDSYLDCCYNWFVMTLDSNRVLFDFWLYLMSIWFVFPIALYWDCGYNWFMFGFWSSLVSDSIFFYWNVVYIWGIFDL